MSDDAPTASEADVFISYASADAAVAISIVAVLELSGLRCWIAPRDVEPGSLYADGIVRAINGTEFFVVVLSEHAIASAHVGKELERASSKRRPIYSVRTDAAPLTPAFEYFLSESQWIEVGRGGADAAAAKLISAIRKRATLGHPSDSSTQTVSAQSHSGPLSRRRLWAIGILAAVVVAAIGWLLGDRLRQANTITAETSVATSAPNPLSVIGAPSQREKSIAVLPFTDMSEMKDQEYLADGMAEEILILLAQVPDLLVPGRTSSFYFKGKQTKIADIARELGVTQVLEGSIRVSGNRLRVTAQLIRADTGYQVWSERYDRELSDIFQVQDEIANAVAQAMQIHLMGGTLARRKGGTENLEAYQLHLRAVSARQRHTRASLDESDGYLQPALEIDPEYGMAWMLMANNSVLRADSGFVAPNVGYERGRQIAHKVLEFSPDYAPAYATLLYVYRTLDWDWVAAEAAGQRALALDPNDSWALSMGAALAATLGRWDDAEQKIRTLLVQDPLDVFGIWILALSQYNAARYTDFEATIQRLLQLAPDFMWARAYLGKTYLAQGKPQAALEMVQQESDEWVRLWFLPIVLRAAGRQAEADEALDNLIARATPGSGPYFIAMNYAYRGDTELAFEWLERAYQERDFALVEIVGEVLFANIAHDPRFSAFLIRMKLPTEWATHKAMAPPQSGE